METTIKLYEISMFKASALPWALPLHSCTDEGFGQWDEGIPRNNGGSHVMTPCFGAQSLGAWLDPHDHFPQAAALA